MGYQKLQGPRWVMHWLPISKQRGCGRDPSSKARLRSVERTVGFVSEALGFDPELRGLKRQEARSVVEYMHGSLGMKAATCSRYLNDLRAVFNHGCAEFDLIRQTPNPFLGLNPKADRISAKIEKRQPLTTSEIDAVTRSTERSFKQGPLQHMAIVGWDRSKESRGGRPQDNGRSARSRHTTHLHRTT